MTKQQQHPITPPPELVQQWASESLATQHLCTQAARWGSDQELEACINYFHEYDTSWGEDSDLIAGLRTDRRPKPPILKEQALDILKYPKDFWSEEEVDILRRALEQLDD